MPAAQIGHYRITERLGQGGMGEIFAAHDRKLNRTVAVKFIANDRVDDETSRRLFMREARAAAGLDHPFICTVHEVLEHEGQPVIVMERVEGETLLARIGRGPLTPGELGRVTLEITEALAAAHARGVIHRDIKSANVMITPSGHVKVMDFGLALITRADVDEETAHVSEELRSKAAGTLPYMAPEVLRGDDASSASDLYGLGVVMYEMATGSRPFQARSDAVLISEILERAPTSPRQLNAGLTPAVEGLIVRLLAKDPARRPTADEVIAELRSSGPDRERQRSLAVLPFHALTADPDSAYLGVALADATTGELALVRSLLVRPTAAILKYQNAPDAIAAGRELGVDAVVAGTYQRAGSRLRVTVQLISVAEERPLWSTKVDSTLDDIFAMQDEVSRKVVEALNLELTPADEQRIANRPQPAGDVLELCARGRVRLLRENIADVNQAIELFEKARDIDPSHPLPWIGLADSYVRFAFNWDPDGGWYERAREHCDRALALDPHIPEARYIRARLAWTPQGGFDHEYAIREIAASLAERPNMNEGFAWLATVLFHVGLLDEARTLYERAHQINPDDSIAFTHLPTVASLSGDYRSALRMANAATEAADTSWTAYATISAHIYLGDLDSAERALAGAMRKFPAVVLFHSLGAVVAASKGDEQRARREIDRTERQRNEVGHFHHAEFDVACALALLGHSDEAIRWLTAAVRNGFPCLPAVENDPFLARLRSTPQYAPLITELRQQRDHYKAVYESVRDPFRLV